MWSVYLFIVYFTPKLLKLVGVGVFGGVFLGSFLSVLSLIVTWVWPGVPYLFSNEQLHVWGLTE